MSNSKSPTVRCQFLAVAFSLLFFASFASRGLDCFRLHHFPVLVLPAGLSYLMPSVCTVVFPPSVEIIPPHYIYVKVRIDLSHSHFRISSGTLLSLTHTLTHSTEIFLSPDFCLLVDCIITYIYKQLANVWSLVIYTENIYMYSTSTVYTACTDECRFP